MALTARTRIRCAVYPSKVGDLFVSVYTQQNPQIYKGAGVDFEIALFDLDGSLSNVANVAQLNVLVKPRNSPDAAAEMSKATTNINQALDSNGWNSGVGYHAVVSFTGAEANIAAGDHDITVHGLCNDNGVDPRVFGRSVLKVIDAGILSGLAAAPNVGVAITMDDLNSVLGNYIPRIAPPGMTLTFTSGNGRVKRILGVADATPADPTPTIQRVDSAEVES